MSRISKSGKKTNTMTQEQLICSIAEQTKFRKSVVKEVLTELMEHVRANTFHHGIEVHAIGFRFILVTRKARKINDSFSPLGIPESDLSLQKPVARIITIPATKRVSIRPSGFLKGDL